MRLWALSWAVLLVMAGCSDAPSDSDEVVLVSVEPGADVQEETSGESLTKQTPKSGQRGHLTGFVLDDSLRPVPGALVTLPGLNATDRSGEDGAFAFPDLWPGPYRVTAEAANHRSADTVVEVPADEFVKLKFILERVAPPTPRHETQVLTGFADVAVPYHPVNFVSFCNACVFFFDLDLENLEGVVLEVYREQESVADLGGSDYFIHLATMSLGAEVHRAYHDNPAMVRLEPEDIPDESSYYLNVRPFAQSVPEFSVSFQIFITAFYHEPPPENWSFLDQQ